MPKSCNVCYAVASLDLQLQYCAQCQSALYCSRACQRIDWKKQHKQLCKFLNVGHGVMQVRTQEYGSRSIALKKHFERGKRSLVDGEKRFFKLFEETTEEGSRATAQNMTKYAKRQTKEDQKFLLYHSLFFLVHSSNSEMLSWPNSPLLVLLQFVDPNMLFGDEETMATPLHYLAEMADPFDYSTHKKQLILAKQLVEHGANVNAVSNIQDIHGMTPLHKACFSGNVTNLDVVEYLLEAGANPSAQDNKGETPLIYTTPDAPGAAKFLLNWPTTDANNTNRSGASFLVRIRHTVKHFFDKVALPDNPAQVQHQFKLQQWRDIEAMLVERGGR